MKKSNTLIEDIKENKILTLVLIVGAIVFHTFVPVDMKELIEKILGFICLFIVIAVIFTITASAHNGNFYSSLLIVSIVVYGTYYFNGQNYPLAYISELIPIIIYGIWNIKKF